MRRVPIPTLVALVLCAGASGAAWYEYETRPYQDNQRNWLLLMAWTAFVLSTLLALRVALKLADR